MITVTERLADSAEIPPASAASVQRAVHPGRDSGQSVVRLSGVSRRFGDVVALEDVSLEIRRGEILGIIGRSGAGKSTLIRCLNGLERPDRGRIEILGRDIVPMRERELQRLRGRVGMIFQHFNLLSAKTVAENVALPLKIAGRKRAERRQIAADLLGLVGLAAKADAYPAKLSGGQKQRVGIARALAADPALLLSDEATSAVDPETTGQILDLLRDINHRLGLTIVLITHEMRVVRAIADRVIVLDRGRVVEQGSVGEVFARPVAEVTRRLLAASRRGLPAFIQERLRPEWTESAALVAELLLSDHDATEPVLTDVASSLDIRPVLLHAAMEQEGERRLSRIVFGVPDAAPGLASSLADALLPRGGLLEVLGYVQQLD